MKKLIISLSVIISLCALVFLYILLSPKDSSQKIVTELLQHADITINGTRPWDIQVHNKKFYDRVLAQNSLGLGESYMDGWWDCQNLDQFFFKILKASIDKKVKKSPRMIFDVIKAKLFNLQSKYLASHDVSSHYNLGNDLYKAMLDKRMVYTCAYWHKAQTLDEAQEAKLDLICKKIGLKPGMKILDVGCGWGSFAKFAAEKYGVSVVGITISQEQVTLAQELCAGLPVEIRLQDYRDINELFDRIVSIGMIEHVGFKNYEHFMHVVHRCLKDDGLFLLHTIGGNISKDACEPWTNKYIFPHGSLPSMAQLSKAMENYFIMEDWHNFGQDYDHTLMAWFNNFNNHWDELKNNYDQHFYRMWKYYLLSCAGAFRARNMQLWQLVLSKNGVPGGYVSVR